MLLVKNYAHFIGGRLNRCVVFFAVRKDVDDIKREDFKKPEREDKYGTSVMSIQFTKNGLCTVSIKNRYNHTVNNPDATYGNDLDRISEGLTQSFNDLLTERGLDLNNSNIQKLPLDNYIVANDGKFYKFNMEMNGIYYCPGNVIIDQGEVKHLEPEKEELIDYFILDKKTKTLRLYDQTLSKDSFIDCFDDVDKMQIEKDKETNTRVITAYPKGDKKPITIRLDINNQIVGYHNENVTEVGDHFLTYGEGLKDLYMPNLQNVGDWFLTNNEHLDKIDLQKLVKAGNHFIGGNNRMAYVNLPSLVEVGNAFLDNNNEIKSLVLQNLIRVGDGFLNNNMPLSDFQAPKLEEVGNNFLKQNARLRQLTLPNLRSVGFNFLRYSTELTELTLPKLEETDDYFLSENTNLASAILPSLRETGSHFLNNNRELTSILLPNLQETGDDFLEWNRKIEAAELPKLKKAGARFFCWNNSLKKLELPSLTDAGEGFLEHNELTDLETPKLKNNSIKARLTPKDIAEVSLDSEITTTDINLGRRIIDKIRSMFKAKQGNDR